MPLPLPTSLSPSKVASFKDCALAFRFSAIDRLPEPPTPWATRGTLVHRALELLFCEDPDRRTLDAALDHLATARVEMRDDPELVGLYLQEPVAIIATPTEQSIRGLRQRTEAIWHAVERACVHEDFRPRPSRLCDYCNFQAYCPAFGGDPARASELLTRATA